MKKMILTVIFLTCSILSFADQVLTYRESTGDSEMIYEIVISETTEGYLVRDNQGTYWLDSQFETYRCEFTDEETDTDVIIQRNDGKILIEGKHKGKTIRKEYSFDDVWFQFTEIALQSFSMSQNKKTRFWIIRSDNLRLGEMEAKKMGEESIEIAGSPVQAVYVRVKFTGFLSVFWHADYWFRVSDGRYLRYEAVRGGSGAPPTVI
jgi:hypothetical protein